MVNKETDLNGFRLEEATIADMHEAIRSGRVTCVQIVKHYIARAQTFNGVASRLVTSDGASISPATGTVRAGAPLQVPVETVPVSQIYPDLEQYQGTPLELGRMEPTMSDPTVQQQ